MLNIRKRVILSLIATLPLCSCSAKGANKELYTATFLVDGNVVERVNFHANDKYISEPEIPYKKGYVGYWENYSLSNGNIIINALYDLETYVASFYVDGKIYREVSYNIETYSTCEIPDIPKKDDDGHTSYWYPEVDYSVLENRNYDLVTSLNFLLKHGGAKYENNGYKSILNKTLAIYKYKEINNGTFSMGVSKAAFADDAGLVFNLSYDESKPVFWEDEHASYYFFFYSLSGYPVLSKIKDGKYTTLVTGEKYSSTETNVSLKVSMDNGTIQCYLNDEIQIKYVDENYLTGSKLGFRTNLAGTLFSNLKISDEPEELSDDINGYRFMSGKATLSGKIITTTSDKTLLLNTQYSIINDRTYATRITANKAQNAGIIFGIKDNNMISYWEDNISYYFYYISSEGKLTLAYINNGIFTIIKEASTALPSYSATTQYSISITVKNNTTILCYLVGTLALKAEASYDLVGSSIGLRADLSNTSFQKL